MNNISRLRPVFYTSLKAPSTRPQRLFNQRAKPGGFWAFWLTFLRCAASKLTVLFAALVAFQLLLVLSPLLDGCIDGPL